MLLNRLLNHMKQNLPDLESMWLSSRTWSSQYASSEKCHEQHRDLCKTFVDLTKAFDAVSHAGLWKTNGEFGGPDRFIALVCARSMMGCKSAFRIMLKRPHQSWSLISEYI